MSCSHIDTISTLPPPRLSQAVHREECTQCFDNQDLPAGIDVCLVCFNGGCLDNERRHAQNHVQKSGHKFTLNIKRKVKPSAQRAESEEPPAKMTKLAIVEEREEDKYDQFTVVKCWLCDREKGLEVPEASSNPGVKSLVDGVLQSLSSARQSEVKAWEEEIVPCEHTLTLEQLQTGPIPQSGLAHCNACDLKENLWLCLTCGSLGCGRQQYGGLGGNGHGLAHFESTGHAVSVKLGTITAEGEADIYCYVCNDAKQDPELARHLSTFGINVQTLTKTEKSMTELQIEHNLKYDFSLVGEDGQALEPVFGPGLTGLANLGNSCYMASVLQTIFSLPAFQKRYNDLAVNHARACTVSLPADCVECQMHKVADGLLSGRYSHPANYAASPHQTPTVSSSDPLQHASPTPVFQTGIRPAGFKTLIGKGHEEFSTMKQQDSEEFFTHLLTVLRRDMHKFKDRSEQDATTIFSYALEQRLQCNDCKKVRYRNDTMDSVSVAVPAKEKSKDAEGKIEYEDVLLTSCLDALLSPEALEYSCPSCQKNVHALKQTKFASFPETLVVHAKKFQLVNWVPTKLGEEEFPAEAAEAAPGLPEFNAAAMAQLEGMGFPTVRCQKALLATGNSDPEAAMEWLFAHMEDPDIDDPIPIPGPGGSSAGPEPSPEQVAMLADMGFTPAQAKKALRETSGNAERAVEWLFNHPDDTGEEAAPAPSTSSAPPTLPGSTAVPARYKLKAFISHKGPSVHSGHYVAHIRVSDDQWVLFNDEKVVKADAESVRDLKRLAYLYVFEKI
ncbi:ubiquitin carboxyl-terminal hydrolase 14 [Coprinopsis cinerea okayama7|uniref:Ubiquitin carboxyl-terminal hydrolase n=1 Tax=Coprinopsis cinerea (strain Okayama-7 / 130 / ATCC MYA-4618 / FGSC 9003) TaxID=240176 RepID=A8NLE1_COPC7|nr:ubiquitin carboxyl-terminal hydrolase 14 [Coprinopsis cinerea okayama7\|eukprot:XP_001834663.2 ubiquitin carboxyl-terminal hydrolase 14 [Coprinopsis cinerea okayama7\